MDLGLSGKKVLVTGSTKGIGFATAKLFAAEGADVFINGRTEESVNLAVDRILKETVNSSIKGIVADLSNAKGCQALLEELPKVDVLINNLGIFEPVPFAEIKDEDWLRFFEVNVMSGVRLSRHYIESMREKNWGRIIFIASESAVQIPEEMIHYGMTKTAQVAVSRGLAETTKGTGVTVNSILPGPTRSEGVEEFVQQIADQQGMTFDQMEKEFFASARPSSLLQRFADVDEVANLIVYTGSALASATNGAALRVDGGVVKAIL